MSLFDHLVGAGEQRLRHGQPECLRGFEINDELILGRRLHREIAWLLTFEDAIDVAGGTPKLVDKIKSIRDQAAAGDKVAPVVDRRQPVPGGERDD